MMEVTEDMETTLQCVSPGGKPAADVSLSLIKKIRQVDVDEQRGYFMKVLLQEFGHFGTFFT